MFQDPYQPNNSILPYHYPGTKSRTVVTEVMEYDGDGNVTKRTVTTVTETDSPSWGGTDVWCSTRY